MDQNKPYKNWTKKELERTLVRHVGRLDISEGLKFNWTALITEAFKSDWDPIEDYNGCSVVQDYFHPCPACFCHDYMWINGHGGKMSDVIFYHLMIAEGMKQQKAKRRFYGVRLAWVFFYKWNYLICRKINGNTEAMKRLFDYLN